MLDSAAPLPPLTAEMLRAPVGRALAAAGAGISNWQVTPLSGGLGLLASLSRVAGRAQRQGTLVPWSLVLKIILPPTTGGLVSATNWRREFHTYVSGLLRALPQGLRAPHCYGAEDRAEQGLWLWQVPSARISRSW
jgi:hypothetical protein